MLSLALSCVWTMAPMSWCRPPPFQTHAPPNIMHITDARCRNASCATVDLSINLCASACALPHAPTTMASLGNCAISRQVAKTWHLEIRPFEYKGAHFCICKTISVKICCYLMSVLKMCLELKMMMNFFDIFDLELSRYGHLPSSTWIRVGLFSIHIRARPIILGYKPSQVI